MRARVGDRAAERVLAQTAGRRVDDGQDADPQGAAPDANLALRRGRRRGLAVGAAHFTTNFLEPIVHAQVPLRLTVITEISAAC